MLEIKGSSNDVIEANVASQLNDWKELCTGLKIWSSRDLKYFHVFFVHL